LEGGYNRALDYLENSVTKQLHMKESINQAPNSLKGRSYSDNHAHMLRDIQLNVSSPGEAVTPLGEHTTNELSSRPSLPHVCDDIPACRSLLSPVLADAIGWTRRSSFRRDFELTRRTESWTSKTITTLAHFQTYITCMTVYVIALLHRFVSQLYEALLLN
jgi:hypothetical protein